MEKFNFVFYQTNYDYYRIAYNSVIERDDFRYIDKIGDFKNPILRLLFRLHNNFRINRIINLHFKSIWYNSLFKNDFKN